MATQNTPSVETSQLMPMYGCIAAGEGWPPAISSHFVQSDEEKAELYSRQQSSHWLLTHFIKVATFS